jgi:hypothetical protein
MSRATAVAVAKGHGLVVDSDEHEALKKAAVDEEKRTGAVVAIEEVVHDKEKAQDEKCGSPLFVLVCSCTDPLPPNTMYQSEVDVESAKAILLNHSHGSPVSPTSPALALNSSVSSYYSLPDVYNAVPKTPETEYAVAELAPSEPEVEVEVYVTTELARSELDSIPDEPDTPRAESVGVEPDADVTSIAPSEVPSIPGMELYTMRKGDSVTLFDQGF